jgi:RHS repeat-associated protein
MGTNTTLTASGKGANESYRWYVAPSDGSFVSGDSYVTSVLNVQTTYYVSKYNSVTLCESTRTPLIVNVFDPNMSVPPVPSVSSNSCGVKTLGFSNPPANVTYYWQGDDENGYSTSQSVNASSSITVYNTDRYYLKGKHSSGNYWSVNTYVDVIVTNPVAPPVPTVSSNTCGDKTLTRGTPSDGSTWYWQGQNSAGEEVSSTAAAASYVISSPGTTDQHIRAFKLIPGQQTGCWSSAAGVTVTVIKPAMPGMPTVSTLTCGPKTLTKVGTPPGGITWYWQGAVQTEDISSTAAASTYEAQTTNTYYLGARDGNNCWTYRPIQVIVEPEIITINQYDPVNTTIEATRQIILGPGFTAPYGSPFVAKIGISAACEDRINWVESLAYGQDGAVIADSKSYSSGLGMGLQSQSRDFVNNKIFASQPLYDSYNSPSAQTLSAPMIWSDFRYQKDFVRNTSGVPYGKNDFDKNLTAEAGAVDNPNPVGADKPYTLGWYYSSGNNLEALTPTTSYPYSRSYSPADPDPTIGKSSGAGDNYKMGSGHEVVSERQLSTSTELSHYSTIRAHFVTSTLPVVGYKSIVTDPDGKKIVSFEDADGRSLASATLTASVYDNWSYNFYNDMGQLVASVAPNGVNPASNALPAFVTKYTYDHLGQLIQVESPDEGISKFVYNLDGEVRFSENQEQRNASPKRFSYSNYDYLGRLVESGEYITSVGGYFFEPRVASPSASLSILHLVDTALPRGVHVDDLNGGTDPMVFKGPSWKIDPSRCTDYTLIKYDEPSNAPTAQENLEGQISKTQNENTTTWYSYDEFEQLKMMWQQIVPMANAQKKTEYTYDYFGNVTLVAYQAGVSGEQFYHHYEYDAAQKLIKVSTSFDGLTKTVRASYKYYLHGPLKRVELGDKVQGIDYAYNLDGSLKLINHPDPGLDPGYDGLSGVNSAFGKDIFGEALDYNTNDFIGAGYNEGTLTASAPHTDKFGGNVKAIRWHSHADSHIQRAYAFEYDPLNQIKIAKWGNVTGSAGTYGLSLDENKYREEITGSPAPYDKNGNIKGLIRRGKTGNSLANYQYNYYANTNKLQQVVADGDDLNYEYNSIGQMTTQAEGSKVLKVKYNDAGLVREIRNSLDRLLTVYRYDDRGNIVAKVSHDGNQASNPIIKTNAYVQDVGGTVLAIYEQLPGGSYVLLEAPIYGDGRIAVYKPQVQTTFYEVNDHLGNVRGVIGSPEALLYTATMEDNGIANYSNPRVQELAVFKNLSVTEKQDVNMNHTASSVAMPSPLYSAYLRWVSGQTGSTVTQSVGPAIGLKVEPGDKIDMEVWGKFEKNGTSYSRAGITSTVAGILGANFVGSAAGIDVIGNATQVFNDGFAQAVSTAYGNGNDGNAVPFAYLYYVLYDRSFNLITSGSTRMPSTAGYDPATELPSKAHQLLSIPTRNITEPGYIYIFVANESESIKVWFDDLKVIHQRSNVVAGADYYPFGLAMENREITREAYRYGYQGQFSEKDLTSGMQEFELRTYDPKIARWTTADPYGQFASAYVGMGNAPHMVVDPDGGWSWAAAGIGFAVGATTGYIASQGDWRSALAGGVAGGVLGGVSFNQDHKGATRFNGGYREHGALRITFNPQIGNLFRNNWITVANAALQHVGQGVDGGVANTQNCVYACEESFEQYIGGPRTRRDFNSNQNGSVTDRGTQSVRDWANRWVSDFRGNINGNGTSAPRVKDVISNMKRGKIYSVAIREKKYPPNYEHNVLIKKVRRNKRSGKYKYDLMDPNGDRSIRKGDFDSFHKRYLILRP